MSYAERLAQALNNAPQKELFNANKKTYSWEKESKQKRSIR